MQPIRPKAPFSQVPLAVNPPPSPAVCPPQTFQIKSSPSLWEVGLNPPPSGSGIYRYQGGGAIYHDAIEAAFTNPPENASECPSLIDIPLEVAKALGILTPDGNLSSDQPEIWAKEIATAVSAGAINVYEPIVFPVESGGSTDT